ncbi:MAG TPA: T9SS type A sorting domain-containing protein [Bacteroidia bacterium]|jgi:hypothetical protein|nr:T9SS type A sorting domain-containing protein [Bacteroidia bacterium]
MRKLKLVFYFSFFIFHFSFISAQQWCWGADGIGGLKTGAGSSPVATNRFGNAYTTGAFLNSIIFGSDTLIANNNDDNVVIVKYNSRGDVQWAHNPKSFGSATSTGYAIVSDAFDNAYVTGLSSGGTIIFGAYTLTGNNGFFVKYSPTGQVLWAQSYSGVSLAIDKNGNICLATYDRLMKFNPNGNKFMDVSAILNADIFAISLDSIGNIYATGTEQPGWYPFLAKYDSSGNLLWSHEATVTSAACVGTAYSVTTDKAGSAYITGFFGDTMSFGAYTLKSPFNWTYTYDYRIACFLVKYDVNGNVVWAEQTKGKHKWRGTSLAKDRNNNIYLGGSGIDVDTFSFGGGIMTLHGSSSDASFIVKLDTAGKFVAGSLLKNGTLTFDPGDYLNGVAVDSSGNYSYLIGDFLGDTILCADDTLTNPGGVLYPYIARWSWTIPGCINAEEGISEITSSKPNALLYPNPNTGKFTIELVGAENLGSAKLEIYNILGEKVFTKPLNGITDKYSFDLTSRSSGIYLYRIISESGQLINDGKFIIE